MIFFFLFPVLFFFLKEICTCYFYFFILIHTDSFWGGCFGHTHPETPRLTKDTLERSYLSAGLGMSRLGLVCKIAIFYWNAAFKRQHLFHVTMSKSSLNHLSQYTSESQKLGYHRKFLFFLIWTVIYSLCTACKWSVLICYYYFIVILELKS